MEPEPSSSVRNALTFGARIALRGLLCALGWVGCTPEFDTSNKTACIDDRDCLAGYVCLDGPSGRLGVCEPIGLANRSDGGDAADIAEGDANSDAGPLVCVDRDGDGAFSQGGCGALDCDDSDRLVHPSATELCNERDDDCDGEADESFDLLADVNQCGACGNRCEPAHAEVACRFGSCIVTACLPGWVDRNTDGSDGCEVPCGTSEVVCGDGNDDDCDGSPDASDSDCGEPSELAGLQYTSFVWEFGDALPSVRFGTASFDDAGLSVRMADQQRTGLERFGRGAPVDSEIWTVEQVMASGVALGSDRGDFTLRRSVEAPNELLIGTRQGAREFVVLIQRQANTPAPNVTHEWLAWIVSPLNELQPVPGTLEALGWDEPTELALLRFGAPGSDGRGGVTWPFAEFRDSTWASVDTATTLQGMSYVVRPDGALAVEIFDDDGVSALRVFDGASTPRGTFTAGVHRYVGDACVDRWAPAGRCVNDPIVLFSVHRSTRVGPDAMAGDWTLVGIGC